MASHLPPLARPFLRALGLLALTASTTLAQGTVRGRVSDAAARPVPNVNVTVTGTMLVATTNDAGDFVIANVPSGTRTIVTRRLGYARATKSVDVQAGGEATVEFTLTQTASQLEQVVVTGTGGSVERRMVGNSISTLDVGGLNDKMSLASVTEALQGKTPGLVVLPGSGVPGTAGEIRIRGASSTIGYKPVIFIDGIRYNQEDVGQFAPTGGGTAGLAQSQQVTSALNTLNPNDVESIEVIKGPAASTLYGAEAANGVIQIITKKGTRGPQAIRWNFRGETGVSQWHLLPEDNYTTCDAAKQAALLVPADPTSFTWPGCQGLTANTVIRGNPLRDDPRAIRDGAINKTSLSATGGGTNYNFYLSGDRNTELGTFYNSDDNRSSFRSNFGFNPNPKTDFALTMNWSTGTLRLPIQDESANGILLNARRGEPGRASRVGPGNEGWRNMSPTQANRYKNFSEIERLTLATTVNYTPLKWFTNRLTAGFDNTTTQAQVLFLPGDIDVTQDPDAGAGANLRKTPMRKVITLDYGGTVTWNAKANVSTTTTFGSQVIADRTETVEGRGIGIGAPDVILVGLLQRTTGSEAFSENNSVGYYVQEQVGWNDRLFVTGALRADDHSSFGTNFDLIVYPKFSVSYILSDEPAAKSILQSMKVTSLQLRTAWGQAGRSPSAYSAPQTYTVDRVTLGAVTGSALRTSAFGNPDLKPEKGDELEVGFAAGFLSDRVNVDFTFYNKTTKDMLQSINVPASTGFLGTYLTNLGEVNNRGIELSVSGTPLDRESVRWETSLNIGTNKNELIDFEVAGKVLESAGTQPFGVVQQHRKGYPLGGFWVTPPLRCGIDGPPVAPVVADPCPTGIVGVAMLTPAGAAIFNPGDTARRFLGTPLPTRTIGFSNTVTLFKYARVYALLDHQGGHKVFNLQERNRCQAANDNCARANNPLARFPAATSADSVLYKELQVWRSTSVSPEWIQPGDFIKLREVSLTLDLPERLARRARARGANLVLSGRNLAVWSDYEGVDPEVNSYGGRNFVRIDAYAAPMMRRLSAMITLQY